MAFNFNNKFGKLILTYLQKYNHNKYWGRREKVINPNYRNVILKLYYLYYIKRIDSYYNCSFGTNYNSGTVFKTPPKLPHGPKNIIVGHNLIIGHSVTIFHTVTLSHGGSVIGDNVLFSTGSVLLPGRNIGNNCKVGANAVVVENVEDNCTVVLNKPRIIKSYY